MLHPATDVLLRRKQYAQRTPEWYEVRRGLLTASDAAMALGIKPFDSYKGCPRTDCIQKKLDHAPFGNICTFHGQQHEDKAVEFLRDALGERVFEVGLFVHDELPWLAASPDGVTASGILLEIKCPLRRPIMPGVVPHHYMPQVQIQLEVCDMELAWFVQMKPPRLSPTGALEFSITPVHRDRRWFAANVGALRDVWLEYTSRLDDHVPQEQPRPECRVRRDLY